MAVAIAHFHTLVHNRSTNPIRYRVSKEPSFLKEHCQNFRAQNQARFPNLCEATYKVKLIEPDGVECEFDAPDDAYIHNSAESAGVELQYSCWARDCSTCAGKLVSGPEDQSDGSLIDDNQIKVGYLLTGVSYPTSGCVIRTQESDLC